MNAPRSRVESRSNGNGYNRPASGDSAWRRFGAPEGNSVSRPAERAAPQPDSNNAGWHRFGYPGDRGSAPGPRSAPNQNRDAERILAIDGCPLNCVANTLRKAGINNFEHLELQTIGLRKGSVPVTDESIARGVEAAEGIIEQIQPEGALVAEG